MAKIGKLFGAGSLIKSQNYLRRVVYRTTVEDPWSMRVHELRAAVIAEAAPGAAFLFPDRDQTIFKPDWHLASILDNVRVGGGLPNVQSLQSCHPAVSAVIFLDCASVSPPRPFTVTVKGCGATAGSRPCKVRMSFYTTAFKRSLAGNFLPVF
jgi:hypothetical protein